MTADQIAESLLLTAKELRDSAGKLTEQAQHYEALAEILKGGDVKMPKTKKKVKRTYQRKTKPVKANA